MAFVILLDIYFQTIIHMPIYLLLLGENGERHIYVKTLKYAGASDFYFRYYGNLIHVTFSLTTVKYLNCNFLRISVPNYNISDVRANIFKCFQIKVDN